MMSSQLGSMANVVVISTSMSPVTTTLDGMIDQRVLILVNMKKFRHRLLAK